METVGIVGVGAMGRMLLGRLKLAGVTVTAYDHYAPAVEAARSLGASIAASPAEVARASAIIDVVVRTDQEMLDAVMGKDGVLSGARPDALLLLHSTVHPKITFAIAEAASARNVRVLDACMVGIPEVVQAGNMSFLVGGPADLVERARPHLLRMGKQVLHMGPLGCGNVAKIIKNLVTGSKSLVVHEAIRIGEAAGIRYTDALEMMRKVYTGSVVLRWENNFDPAGSNSRPHAGENIYGKDVPLASELAKDYGVEVPIIDQLAVAGTRLLEAQKARLR